MRDPFSGFGQPPFGMASFGPGPMPRSPLNRFNDPFISSPFGNFGNFGNFRNFGPLGTSSSSFSSFSSNSFSGGSQGGYVRKSTTTQIVNGVRKTVTTTDDGRVNNDVNYIIIFFFFNSYKLFLY